MRKTIKVIVLLAAFPVSAVAGGLIGSTIPPLPPGLVQGQGACVGEGNGQAPCNHSIGILENAKGESTVLFGARLAGRNAAKEALWTITDTMAYPRLADGQALMITTCRVAGGEEDGTLFAAVRLTDDEWFTDVAYTLHYDLATGKLQRRKGVGVECLNEGWGL